MRDVSEVRIVTHVSYVHTSIGRKPNNVRLIADDVICRAAVITRVPKLTSAIITNDDALHGALDQLLLATPNLRRLTRDIGRLQAQLRRRLGDAEWAAYLALEERVNARATSMLEVVARWSFGFEPQVDRVRRPDRTLVHTPLALSSAGEVLINAVHLLREVETVKLRGALPRGLGPCFVGARLDNADRHEVARRLENVADEIASVVAGRSQRRRRGARSRIRRKTVS